MNVVFEERQRLPLWMTSLVVLVVGGGTVTVGRARWTELVIVLGLTAVLLVVIRMRTTVTTVDLEVVMFPVPRKSWPLDDVERCEAVTYRPLLHYGGWGWRWGGSARGPAYTMRGKRGVMVYLRNGKRFLVGSQRPDELVAALESAKRGPRSEV